MRLPFFKHNDEPDAVGGGTVENNSIQPVGNAEIELVQGDAKDLAQYECVSLDVDIPGRAAFFDSLIPMASGVVDAAAQYDHAVIRFPEGAKWKDLIDRKTPGWEEWKTLTPFKDGSFQPQAAIKQVGLPPTAVANIALQGAAVAVGQAYMAEISKQLEGIEAGIASIQQEMRLEREAKIEASFEMLREYAALYGEISQNPEKRQAVLNGIEGIRKDVREAWGFQVRSMIALNKRLSSSKRMKDDEVRAGIREFQSRESDALAVFKLLIAAEQTSMQYDGDFSTSRIEREREQVQRRLEEYEVVRSGVQASLKKRIDAVPGSLLAIPELKDDGYEPGNPLRNFAHAAAVNADRLTPLAMRKEAGKQLKEKKRRYEGSASADNPIALIADGRDDMLDKMDFMYNQADSIMVDGDGIHFLKRSGEGANDQSDSGGQDGAGLAGALA